MGKVSDYARVRQAATRGAPVMQINPVFPRETLPVAAAPQMIEETRSAYENYADMTVDQILEAVKLGQMNSTEVIALEQTGKQRSGILKALGVAPVEAQVEVEVTPETPGQ